MLHLLKDSHVYLTLIFSFISLLFALVKSQYCRQQFLSSFHTNQGKELVMKYV